MSTLTAEQRDFLLEPVHTGKLATVRKDGRPHVVPVWFEMDGDTLIFTTGKTTVKAANLRRDNRVSICVDNEQPPFSYIQIEGTVELLDDTEALRYWATRIGGRYMGAERAEEYGERNAAQDELLVRMTPTHIIFHKDIAD